MGTNAVPSLLKMVRVRDSVARQALVKLSARQSWLPVDIRTGDDLHFMACHGFELLGPIAKPAVPALIRLLGDKDWQVRNCAAVCLGRIGPAAQDAVPVLAKNLSVALEMNKGSVPDCDNMVAAAFALGEIGAASRSAISQLTALSTLTNTFWQSRSVAKAALINIKGDPQLLLTDVIKDALTSRTGLKKSMVIYHLGTNGGPGIPFLLTALQQPFSGFQMRALDLLVRIHAQPEVCIPAIAPLLQSPNYWTRLRAIQSICAFGVAVAVAAGA